MKAFNTGDSTLMLVSNLRNSLDRISPTSMRDFSILGSTSTATICNIHNTGKMVLMAAGQKAMRGLGVATHTGFAVSRLGQLPGCLETCSCTGLTGRTEIISKRGRLCSPVRVSLVRCRLSPSLCPSMG